MRYVGNQGNIANKQREILWTKRSFANQEIYYKPGELLKNQENCYKPGELLQTKKFCKPKRLLKTKVKAEEISYNLPYLILALCYILQ